MDSIEKTDDIPQDDTLRQMTARLNLEYDKLKEKIQEVAITNREMAMVE